MSNDNRSQPQKHTQTKTQQRQVIKRAPLSRSTAKTPPTQRKKG